MASPNRASPLRATDLTMLCAAGGCGSKASARTLASLLEGLAEPAARTAQTHEGLLLGADGREDAAIYRLRDDLALVLTVDFFTPLVNDPYDFGRIAAANALSDVYAMGGMPLTALNIAAFPFDLLDSDVFAQTLRGGADVVSAAGAVVVGGHTIRDREPKYGLAVTGVVDPQRMTTNAGARAGDLLVLSKPLGTGAIVTAQKRGHGSDDLLEQAIGTMVTLNDLAARAAVEAGVQAMTDVTGYGLLGHLHNICTASGLAAEVHSMRVPFIQGVEPLLDTGVGISSGTRSNLEWAGAFTDVELTVPEWRKLLLADATTSGGLLISVPPERVDGLVGTVIGRLHAGEPGAIRVV